MAILLLVNTAQENPPYNNIDDIVGVFDDDHPFSETEQAEFNFMTVTGSREDVERRLNEIRPYITKAFYNESTEEYMLIPITNNEDSIKVWSTKLPPIRWYEIVERDKFVFSVADLTQAEKDFIADSIFDINSPTIDNYIKKMVKDIGRKPENSVEIKELRGNLD